MSVANERLLDRVRHFVEPRLAYIGLRVGEFWRQALAVLSVWSLSGQGPEPFPHRVGPNGQTAARIFFLGVRWGQNRILVLFPPKNGIRFRTIEQTSEHQLDQARKAGFEIDDDNAVFDNGTSGISTRLIERPEGKRLFDKLRRGDVLVVRWVDRLGRNYDEWAIRTRSPQALNPTAIAL